MADVNFETLPFWRDCATSSAGERHKEMKRWLVIAGIAALLLGGAYLLLSFYVVKWSQGLLQKAIGPGWTISQVKTKMTHFSIHGLRFEDPHTKQKYLEVGEVNVYPAPFSFLRRRLQIKDLVFIKPSLFFYRTREGDLIGPWVSVIRGEEKGEASSHQRREKERETLLISIDRLRIEKGSIDFEDRKAGEPFGRIRWREMEIDLKKMEYPTISSRSPFESKGKILGPGKTGEMVVHGWFDIHTADVDASLRMSGVDLSLFEPYYRKRVSAEIESGQFNMDAHLSIRKRVIDLPMKLEVVDLHIREEGTLFYLPARELIPQLKDRGNRLEVRFHVKGSFDDPKFKLEERILMHIGFGLAEAVGLPVRTLGGRLLEGSQKPLEGLQKNRGHSRTP